MLHVSYQPIRDEPAKRSIALLAVMATTAIVSALVMQHWVWGVMAAGLLLFAMRSWFIKTEIDLREDAVTIATAGFKTRRLWSDFRRVEQTPNGVLLSPFATASRLDSFRSVFIRCPHEQRREVYDFARAHIAADTP